MKLGATHYGLASNRSLEPDSKPSLSACYHSGDSNCVCVGCFNTITSVSILYTI